MDMSEERIMKIWLKNAQLLRLEGSNKDLGKLQRRFWIRVC